jgi:hypothetical protein
MIIPNCIKEAKAGDILATKYGNLLMFEHYDVEDNELKVYSYFDYDGDKIYMNEWLTGFYGPKIDEDFFRISTTEECEKFIHLMYEYGYELHEEYGKKTPRMTKYEFHRKYKCEYYQSKDQEMLDDIIFTAEHNIELIKKLRDKI